MLSPSKTGSSLRFFRGLRLLLALLFIAAAPQPSFGSTLNGSDLGSPGDGAGASSAWTPAGHFAVSFVRSGSNQVIYREFDGSSWSDETAYSGLNQIPRYTATGSMVVDSPTSLTFKNGNPYIFFYDAAAGSLRVAYKSASTWVSDLVDSAAGAAPSAGVCGAELCVSYFAQSSRDLKFARGIPGSWSRQTVDGSSTEVGAFNKLAVNAANKAVIAYYDGTNRTLKIASEGSPSFTLQSLTFLNHSFGLYPSIAIGTDGSIHVAASRLHAAGSGPEVGLYYAVKRSGSWDVAMIARNYAGGSTAISLDSSNRPSISYYYRRLNSQFGNDASIGVMEYQASGYWKSLRVSGALGAAGAHYRFNSISASRGAAGSLVLASFFDQESFGSNPAKTGLRLFSDPADQLTGGSGGGGGGSGGGGPDSDGDGLSDASEALYGTDINNPDTDGDGVEDGQETIDGSNPLDRGSNIVHRGTTFCSEWNGFLTGPTGSMWNILELVSQGTDPLFVSLSLESMSGQVLSQRSVVVAPGAQADVLVHDMDGRSANAYGRICMTHSGRPGDLDGRMVYYRVNTSSNYEFAFAMPLTGGSSGAAYVPFNTYQPSLNPLEQSNFVANWIELANQSGETASGTLSFYDMSGAVIGQVRVTLPAGSRVDQSGHQFGQGKVGLVEWQPDSASSVVQMRNVRYYYDNAVGSDRFNSAFQLEAQSGTGETVSVPVDTTGSTAVVEVANVLSTAATATIFFYNENGDLLSSLAAPIAPKASQHFIVNSVLGDGQKGVVLVSGGQPGALIVTGMEYGRGAAGGLSFVYGMNAVQALGSVLHSSYNTYLSQDSYLVLVNPTSSATSASLQMVRSTGASVLGSLDLQVPAHGRRTIRLNDYEGADNYGIVTVQADPGSIAASVLRYRGSDYVIPTPVRE